MHWTKFVFSPQSSVRTLLDTKMLFSKEKAYGTPFIMQHYHGICRWWRSLPENSGKKEKENAFLINWNMDSLDTDFDWIKKLAWAEYSA